MPTTNAIVPPEVDAPAAHRPRFRITIGTMLLVTAIAALNFAAVRRMDWPNVGWGYDDGGWAASDPAGGEIAVVAIVHVTNLGYLPYVDVVLACTAIAATGLLRGDRAGRRASTAAAFFGIHLTALVWIATTYLPESAGPIGSAIEAMLSPAVAGWLNFVGAPEGRAWDIVGGLLVAAALSGPALLLTMILAAIGVYAARTLPRARFLATAALTSLAFAMTGLAVCVRPRTIEEYEFIDVPLGFRVVDSESGRPVEGAVVRVIDAEPDFYAGLPGKERPTTVMETTDSRGTALMMVGFRAEGMRNAFMSAGHFSAWGRWLVVEADRRRLVRPLHECIGQLGTLGETRTSTMTLPPGKAPPWIFRHMAGSYGSSTGFTWESIDIEPDGRFEACSGGCTGETLDAYGFLRRDGDEIELLPIPRVYPQLDGCPTRYRLIVFEGRVAALEVVRSGVTSDPRSWLARRED